MAFEMSMGTGDFPLHWSQVRMGCAHEFMAKIAGIPGEITDGQHLSHLRVIGQLGVGLGLNSLKLTKVLQVEVEQISLAEGTENPVLTEPETLQYDPGGQCRWSLKKKNKEAVDKS